MKKKSKEIRRKMACGHDITIPNIRSLPDASRAYYIKEMLAIHKKLCAAKDMQARKKGRGA